MQMKVFKGRRQLEAQDFLRPTCLFCAECTRSSNKKYR